MKYTSMMVAAYQSATGKTEEETLQDLGMSGLFRKQDLEPVADKKLIAALVRDTDGVKAWRPTSRSSSANNPIRLIAEKVAVCPMCHSLSGCIMADYKGMTRSEMYIHLSSLSDERIDKLLDYHNTCPFKDRVPL